MQHRCALLGGLLLLAAAAGQAASPTPHLPASYSEASPPRSASPAVRDGQRPVLPTPAAVEKASIGARLPRLALVILLIATLLAATLMTVALLALRRSRNRIAAANDALHRVNASLEEALKIRTEFFATTSHEIRTPLNGILGMTQVLLADRRLDPELRDRIGAVHGAGETMKALVDDVLDMAKIESGTLAVEQTPLDPVLLLTESAQLWRGLAESKGVQLELELGDCPDRILGDRVRLRQIVSNLLSNALKFTSRGTVRLSARTERTGAGEMLVVRVEDSGIGISAEQQHVVFDKFRQADGSIARRFGGTGLGLAICRSLVEAMGGTIVLESRPGEGATFTVRLPLLRPPSATSPLTDEAADQPAEALAGARLLIVEQNALTRRILCNMLNGFVGRIEAVGTAEEAADRLAAGGIDHVVADAASASGQDTGVTPPLERLALSAASSGAHMTLLYPPSRAEDAARFVAVHPQVQPIAKPIAAPALVGALDRLYPQPDSRAERQILAAAPRR